MIILFFGYDVCREAGDCWEAGSHLIVISTFGKMDYLLFGTKAFGEKPKHVLKLNLATSENLHICQDTERMPYSDCVLIYSPSQMRLNASLALYVSVFTHARFQSSDSKKLKKKVISKTFTWMIYVRKTSH